MRDKGIPEGILGKTECVVIVPGMKKGGFIVGGSFGRGAVTCRGKDKAGWGAPAMVEMGGASVGFQIGASATDVVMLVMDRNGMISLLKSKFTLGGDMSVAAGPVGRGTSAETDAANAGKDPQLLARLRGLGRAMAAGGDTSLPAFFARWEPWTRAGALELRVIETSESRLDFDVTRCRYAEMYRSLGIPELGEVLSCQRDAALIDGFAPEVTLTRTQTLMQGAPCCDFRYARRCRAAAELAVT